VFKRVVIIHHPRKLLAMRLKDLLVDALSSQGVDVAEVIPLYDWQDVATDSLKDVDLVISVGGDGTLIRVSHIVLNLDIEIPIWPIAAGEFNFMPDSIGERYLAEAVHDVLQGQFVSSSRNVMNVSMPNDRVLPFVNDIVFMKDKPLDILDMNISIEGEFLGQIKGDGIIVATSSGSTAYSLSAGGPIISQDAPVYVLTPVNPHHITVRPLVLSQSHKTKICVKGRQWHMLVDGVMDMLWDNDMCAEIMISRKVLKFIHVNKYYSWVKNVKIKFHWGSRYAESDDA